MPLYAPLPLILLGHTSIFGLFLFVFIMVVDCWRTNDRLLAVAIGAVCTPLVLGLWWGVLHLHPV